MKKTIKTILWLGLFPIYLMSEALPQNCKEYDDVSQFDYLRRLIRTSSYNFSFWHMKPSETSFYIDSADKESVSLKVYMETHGNGTGTMGWVSYNHKTAQLFDTMPEESLELTYDKAWKDVVKTVFST